MSVIESKLSRLARGVCIGPKAGTGASAMQDQIWSKDKLMERASGLTWNRAFGATIALVFGSHLPRTIMRISRMIISLTIVLMAFIHSAHAADEVDVRPSPLPSLDGHWVMIGDVLGKPVQYDMDASPVLKGKFTEMHMIDVQVPSKYEARVFIGADKSGQLIVHWLDSFGASYSVPHGTGAITGNTVAFSFPYPSGQFRDTLTYHPTQETWSLVIESAKPDGTWEHFARYEIRRNPADARHSSKPMH